MSMWRTLPPDRARIGVLDDDTAAAVLPGGEDQDAREEIDDRADLAAYRRERRRARTRRLATGAGGLIRLAPFWQLGAPTIAGPGFRPPPGPARTRRGASRSGMTHSSACAVSWSASPSVSSSV